MQIVRLRITHLMHCVQGIVREHLVFSLQVVKCELVCQPSQRYNLRHSIQDPLVKKLDSDSMIAAVGLEDLRGTAVLRQRMECSLPK